MEIDTKRFPFTWVKLSHVSTAKNRVWVAICHSTGRIAKLTYPKGQGLLEIMIVNDTYVTNGRCEEGLRCLDKQCPLNNTTRESFAKSIGVKPTRLPEDFPAGTAFRDLDLSYLVKDHPDGGIIQFYGRKKKKQGG